MVIIPNARQFALIVILLNACTLGSILAADALDELLGNEKTVLKEPSAATKKLWEELLTALEKSEIETARPLLKNFNQTNDYVEPDQKTFSLLITEILELPRSDAVRGASLTAQLQGLRAHLDIDLAAAAKANEDLCSEKAEAITVLRKKTAELDAQIVTVNNSIAQQDAIIDRQVRGMGDSGRAANIGEALGNRAGGILGLASSIAGAAGKGELDNHARRKDAAEQEKAGLLFSLEGLRNQITALNATITNKQDEVTVLKSILERDRLTRVSQSDQQHRRLKAEDDGRAALSTIELRSRILKFAAQMKEKENYRPSIALAATYTKQVTDDPNISKLAQDCIHCIQMEAKALEIAKLVVNPINESIAADKLYTAQADLAKADESIALRVTDEIKLRAIKREMSACHSRLDKLLKAVQAKRETIFEVAARDAVEGRKQLDGFVKTYTDYPNFDKDKLKLDDLRQQQVRKKFDQKLLAIREVIHNDPAEAKLMIGKLTNTEMDTDEISIISSELVKVKREILEREEHLIRIDMDDAHTYLTKFTSAYDQIEKTPEHPETALTKRLAVGTENLIRAKSLQVGAVERLKLLMNEEADNVTKARLVSLLEAQKSAVADIEAAHGKIEVDKKEQKQLVDDAAARRQLFIILGASGVGVMAIMMFAGLWMLHRKKKAAVSSTSV